MHCGCHFRRCVGSATAAFARHTPNQQEEGADGATPATILAVGLSFFHFDRPKKCDVHGAPLQNSPRWLSSFRPKACPETSRRWGFLGSANELIRVRKRRCSFSPLNAQRSTCNVQRPTLQIAPLPLRHWRWTLSVGRCWPRLRIPGVDITLTPLQMLEVHWQRSRMGREISYRLK